MAQIRGMSGHSSESEQWLAPCHQSTVVHMPPRLRRPQQAARQRRRTDVRLRKHAHENRVSRVSRPATHHRADEARMCATGDHGGGDRNRRESVRYQAQPNTTEKSGRHPPVLAARRHDCGAIARPRGRKSNRIEAVLTQVNVRVFYCAHRMISIQGRGFAADRPGLLPPFGQGRGNSWWRTVFGLWCSRSCCRLGLARPSGTHMPM